MEATSSSVTISSNWRKLKETLTTKEKTGPNRVFGNDGPREKGQDGDGPRFKKRKVPRKEKKPEVAEGASDQTGEQPRITKTLAMDCEFVGVGEDGIDNMVARISLVNAHGECIYDKYVKPTEPVTDYRTAVSGIREENLVNGEEFSVVQQEVADLIEGHRMVGHAISHDFKVLHLSHPHKEIRDTSKYKPFRAIARTKFPALKKLCRLVLGAKIQEGEHDSVCDARTAMQLYQLHKRDWEARLRNPRSATSRSDTKSAFVVQNGMRVENMRVENRPSARFRYQKRDHRAKRDKKVGDGRKDKGVKGKAKFAGGKASKYRGKKNR